MEPLEADEASALVLVAAPNLQAVTAAEIVSRADGNPLYIEGLAAAAAAKPVSARDPKSLHTAVISPVAEQDSQSMTGSPRGGRGGPRRSARRSPRTTVWPHRHEAKGHAPGVRDRNVPPDVR